jgi:ABC-type dipeptide/oligopeptide/nickel transport system permease component
LLLTVPILLGVSTLVFAMLYLIPGDPVQLMLSESGASPENVARLRAQLGLDEPPHVQYLRFLGNVVRGDLGRSIFNNRPVTTLIVEQLGATLQLTAAGMALGIGFGVTLGVLAAVRPASWLDDLTSILALVGVSMPSFWLGLMFLFLFSFTLGWLPATGQGGLERLIMPATVLGLGSAAFIARLVRSSMLEALHQDYVTTARAKGLAERVVVVRHALRNALIPVATIIGLQFGQLLGGAVITETVFGRQGIGRLAVGAVLSKDFPLVQGTVLLSAVVYLLVNLIVDVSYAYIDPRVRYES